jgi:hypothetical protein
VSDTSDKRSLRQLATDLERLYQLLRSNALTEAEYASVSEGLISAAIETSPSDSVVEKLEALVQLRREDAISDAVFESLKARISMPRVPAPRVAPPAQQAIAVCKRCGNTLLGPNANCNRCAEPQAKPKTDNGDRDSAFNRMVGDACRLLILVAAGAAFYFYGMSYLHSPVTSSDSQLGIELKNAAEEIRLATTPRDKLSLEDQMYSALTPQQRAALKEQKRQADLMLKTMSDFTKTPEGRKVMLNNQYTIICHPDPEISNPNNDPDLRQRMIMTVLQCTNHSLKPGQTYDQWFESEEGKRALQKYVQEIREIESKRRLNGPDADVSEYRTPQAPEAPTSEELMQRSQVPQ